MAWRHLLATMLGFQPHTHAAHGVNSFSNDDDAQVCLLCQLPGQAHCLPLMAPPGERTMVGERVRLAFPPGTLMQMSWAGLGSVWDLC